MSITTNKHTSVVVGSVVEQKKDIAIANTLKSNIPVNGATALEASQALKISDKKEQAKKVDITSNEHTFLTWFLLLLQKLLETTVTTHGMRLESKPYMILFDALKKQGYSLKAWGALNGMGISKTMNYSTVFPVHVEGKTKLVSGSVIYNAIKNNSTYKIFSADKKRYLHYVNNCFHVFHVTTALDKQQEVIELKKIEAIDNVKKEQEKSVIKTEVKKEETKK
jgi:hypothetical protein